MASQSEEFRELERKLKRSIDPTERIDLLNDLGFRLIRNEPVRATELAEEAGRLATEIGDRDRYARSLLVIAAACETRSLYVEGIEKAEEAIAIYRGMGNDQGLANGLNSAGILYRSRSDYGKSLRSFTEAARLFEQKEDTTRLAAALNNLGSVHDAVGNYQSALEVYLRALQLYEAEGNEPHAATVMGNIGNIYYYLKDYDRASEYYTNVLEVVERTKDLYGIAHALGNVSSIYKAAGDYEQALRSLERGLAIFRELGERRYEGVGLVKIGMLCELSGKPEEGLDLLEQGGRILEELNAWGDYCDALSRIGRLHLDCDRPAEALKALLPALEAGERSGTEHQLSNIHETLAEVYERQGDLKRAYHHAREHHRISQSLFGQEVARGTAEMQARFDVESARREMEFHRERADYLETIAEQRSKELTTTAMHLVGKNKLLQSIQNDLQKILAEGNKGGNRKLGQLLRQVEENLRSGDDWQRFEEMYRIVHHDFIRKLSEQYPDLSGTELKVCSLMQINLSNKEIADLLCVSSRTVESHRYRIRKKLNLSAEVNLTAFLAGL